MTSQENLIRQKGLLLKKDSEILLTNKEIVWTL